MKALRRVALALLLAIYLASLGAGWLAPAGYANQFRGTVEAAPSLRFPLGTDELGRDSLARLLYGSRVSLSLAPAGYANQFRGTVEAAPSLRFPLGTDELGRDSLARLLYGSRVSLSLAP